MMELIRDMDEVAQRSGMITADFPVFYFKEYYCDQPLELVFFVSGSISVPAALSKHFFLKKVQLLFVPLNKGQRLSVQEESFFLNELVDFLKNQKLVDRILPSPNYCVFKSVPENAVACPFGTYYLDLEQSTETLWAGLHSKHRNVIRNAEKQGVILKMGISQVPVFYHLYVSTMQRSDMPFPAIDYFEKLMAGMPEENMMCAVVYANEQAQGALLIPYSSYGAYYIYGASADKVTLTGINNFMHWEVIKALKQKNVKRYDFVGARLSDVSNSKLAGIQLFKERFGSVLEKGFLWKMDLTSAAKRYDLLVRMKELLTGKKIVYKDIIDQERDKGNAP